MARIEAPLVRWKVVFGTVAAVLGAAAVLFAGITVLALEVSHVAVVATRTPDGDERRTHVWYVVRDGEIWLEAGSPENPWFRDIEREPVLSLEAEDLAGRWRAVIVGTREAQRAVRDALHAKYGLRDAWLGFLVDSSRSVAVRLDPLADEPG